MNSTITNQKTLLKNTLLSDRFKKISLSDNFGELKLNLFIWTLLEELFILLLKISIGTYHINFLFMNSQINITQKQHNNSLASTVALISTETWRQNSVPR